jgi:predicted nucleic acid-binding protein
MQVVIDTNVVFAYLLSGSPSSPNTKVCKRVINGGDKAYTCDALYGEFKRILDLDPDMIEKISLRGKKEADVLRSICKVRREYLSSRLDPYIMQLNFINTRDLTIDPKAIEDVGNDWYMLAIAKYKNIDYIVTWNTQDVLKYASENGIDIQRILTPPEYLELLK